MDERTSHCWDERFPSAQDSPEQPEEVLHSLPSSGKTEHSTENLQILYN